MQKIFIRQLVTEEVDVDELIILEMLIVFSKQIIENCDHLTNHIPFRSSWKL